MLVDHDSTIFYLTDLYYELLSFDFLEPLTDGLRFRLQNTNFYVVPITFTKVIWSISDVKNNKYGIIKFEDVLENSPEEIQVKLIYNLDIFRTINCDKDI